MAPELKDYEAQTLPTYQAQTDKVNSTYDAKQASDAAALQSAYDANLADTNAALAKLPATYQAQSAVSVAAEQADEYYRAYQSQLANQEYGAEFDRTAADTGYNRSLAQAQTLAAYGDFSGYRALGCTDDQIAQMRAYWRSQQ